MYIISAYDKMQLSGDMAANFRQESNFFWLTKISQPGWMVVEDELGDTRLVRPSLDEIEKKFDGYLPDDKALSLSGAKEVWSHEELEAWLESLEQGTEIGALKPLKAEDFGMTINPSDKRAWDLIENSGHVPVNIRKDLAEKRAIKSQSEVEAMQRSVDATVEVFEMIKSKIDSYKTEAEINADMTAEFIRRGGEHAYQPIVAKGMNACTLHYVDNNQPLDSNGFVLLDVGINIDGYNADITRTYAIGEVSDRHKEVHAAVERSLKNIIEIIKPGLSFKDYVEQSNKIVLSELVKIGLAKGESDEKSLRRYMPHSISHGLGIDVHESLSPHRALKPGMILTVEPGIYIEDEAIGVRIEDNILVTETGNVNLSSRLSTGM